MFFESVGEELDKNEEAFEVIRGKISTIKEDILPNIDCIVEETRVSGQEFNRVLCNYEQELRAVHG